MTRRARAGGGAGGGPRARPAGDRGGRPALPFLVLALLFGAGAAAARGAEPRPGRDESAAPAGAGASPVRTGPVTADPGGGHADGALAGRAAVGTAVGTAAGTAAGRAPGDVPLATLVERLRPTVVSVQATHPPSATERVAGALGPRRGPGARGLASGFIVRADGLVATAAHAVVGAHALRVVLADGRTYRARLIGADPRTDVALLRLEGARALPTAALGDSDRLRVGDGVVAIGNPFGLGHTVTAGIVSAKGRSLGDGPYDDFLQTDAPINPGSSGGPLFDARGEVVGINTAIVADAQGIGFAVPMNTARSVLSQLRGRGHVVRGWVGVQVQDLTPALAETFRAPASGGALVAAVERRTPAGRAGLEVGDVITGFDGLAVESAARLTRLVAETAPGSRVSLVALRGGRERQFALRVGRLPDEPPAAPAAPVAPAARTADGLLGLGAQVEPAGGDDGDAGVVVTAVEPDSLLADALSPGDVLLDIDRRPVRRPGEADAAVRAHRDEAPLLLRVRRDESVVFIPVDL